MKTDLPVESDETAQDAANSLVEQLGSAAAELDGVAAGNPALRAGVAVSLAGVGAPFDGKYVLTSCRHTFDPTTGTRRRSASVAARPARCSASSAARAAPSPLRCTGVVPAIVSNLDDPDGLGRMKVTFPWLGDKSESHWARVADAGRRQRAGRAGHARGRRRGARRVRPRRPAAAVRDRRAVQRQGQAARAGAVDNGKVVKRAIVSRNGHRLEFDDKDDVITIATGDGKHKIVLDQKGSKIVSRPRATSR